MAASGRPAPAHLVPRRSLRRPRHPPHRLPPREHTYGHPRRPDEGREIIRRLSQQVKVLAPTAVSGLSRLLLLTARQAKGREFAACVGYRLFEGEGRPAVPEVFNWYTLLTRTQSRLLLVVSDGEFDRLAACGVFDECQECEVVGPAKASACIDWVMEINSEVNLAEIPSDIEGELLAAFERGEPYQDTYQAIRWAGIPPDGFEAVALVRLARSGVGPGRLAALREQSYSPSLRCLLLRAEGRSWDAAMEAAGLMDTDPDEAGRLIRMVASDLEIGRPPRCPLPLEAARLRERLLGEDWPAGYPLPALRQAPASLPVLFCSVLKEKLRQFLTRRPTGGLDP